MAQLLTPIHPTLSVSPRKNLVTVLVWHDIVPAKKQVWFDTTVAEFETQLRRLERAGASPIDPNQLASYLRNGEPLPPPGAIVLCFDDNTTGIHDYAAPILKKRNWPFAVSAHTAYIGIKTGKAHNTYAMLKALEQSRAIIVSQTHTQPPDLTQLSDIALRREMHLSKEKMLSGLGHAVRFVTYPSGKWDKRVAEAAAEAGYHMALTEDYGPAEDSPHLFAVRRYSTHRRFDLAVQAVRRSARAG